MSHDKEKSKKPIKRNSVRFDPDEGTYALIDADPKERSFDPTIPALVFSEAHKGCGLVILATSKLQVGDVFKVQVGDLPVLSAEIRWREQVDQQVIKLGVMYLE